MNVKEHFTPEEWNQVLQSPMMAALAITAADPGGLWSAVKEGSATARSLIEAKAGGGERPLLAEIAKAFETSEGRGLVQDRLKELIRGKKPAEACQAAVERLGQIAALVREKAPDQAEAFRDWLVNTAQKVAEAGTEGGFLGFGGEKVSEAERKTLADIKRVLG